MEFNFVLFPYTVFCVISCLVSKTADFIVQFQKKIHTHPMSSEIPRGRGILKAKILEAKYPAKLKFPGGKEGAKQKTFHGGYTSSYMY